MRFFYLLIVFSVVLTYECSQEGYLEYLSKYTTLEKSTSRDATTTEFQQRLQYFIVSCKKIHDWNARRHYWNKYSLDFTFYADWSVDEFGLLSNSKQRYSGIRPEISSMPSVFNNTSYRHLLPSIDPCDDLVDGVNPLLSIVSKPGSCSVSWAIAVASSIEYAIKQFYLSEFDQAVNVALSAQEIIDCVGFNNGVDGCDGLPIAWGFDYVYENGISYRQFYPHTFISGECKVIDQGKKYHIEGYEKPSVPNKYGLFELLKKGPAAVSLGLDYELFQHYSDNQSDGVYFNSGYFRPSVYGVVMEYKQFDIAAPYFLIESNLRGCGAITFRIPILDDSDNGNFAGIAGFAIRPIVKELIMETATETPTETPTEIPTETPTEIPTEIPKGEVVVTIIRNTHNNAREESFKLFEGDPTNGTLIYTQPSVSDNQSYTWVVTLTNSEHTLQLTDNSGNGWSDGSNVVLKAGSEDVGTYELPSGSSSDCKVDLSTYESIQDPIEEIEVTIIRKTTSNAGNEIMRIYEGNKHTTGKLVYTQPTLSNNREYVWKITLSKVLHTIYLSSSYTNGWATGSNVVIKVGDDVIGTYTSEARYSYSHYLFDLSLYSTPRATEVTIIRTTKNNANDEGFEIYQGAAELSNLVYTQPTISSYNTYTWILSLSNTAHTLHLTDKSGNGWDSGSNIEIKVGSVTINTFTLESGSSIDYVFDMKEFPPTLYSPCGENLVIKNDNECSKLLQSNWRYISVDANLCSNWNVHLSISNQQCLELLIIKAGTLNNLKSFTVSNNPRLRYLHIVDGSSSQRTLTNVDKIIIESSLFFLLLTRSS